MPWWGWLLISLGGFWVAAWFAVFVFQVAFFKAFKKFFF